MSDETTGHPVTVEFRTPGPLPVTALAALTNLTQHVADQLDAGTLVIGKNFRQEGTDFVFSFTGHARPAPDEDDSADEADTARPPFGFATSSKDSNR
ncbi:hypothetical protein ABZ468_08095 [Streptomyces sp. NPDC005708]|uniref:hypothetical protein n=1 Tax=Streptomyces sp. NPDC005708 TaxID=3154564 RepID=UPI0033CA21F1